MCDLYPKVGFCLFRGFHLIAKHHLGVCHCTSGRVVLFLHRVVEQWRLLGEGGVLFRNTLGFALAQPDAVEVEGRRRSGGWGEGGTTCDGWRKQMSELICIQMVSITFRSHADFEAQVATLRVCTFPRLRDCILLCNDRAIGTKVGRSFGHLIYSLFPKKA